MRGQWTSRSNLDKSLDPDWMPTTVQAKPARDAPVMTLFGAADRNVSTFAVSDALNTATLSCAVREEDARIYCRVRLLGEPHRAVTQFEVSVRFDSRAVPLRLALADVAAWWAAQPGYAPAPVPPAAREPVYSTWYSYHQKLDAEQLLREVELAGRLGMRTIERFVADDETSLTLADGRDFASVNEATDRLLTDLMASARELRPDVMIEFRQPYVGPLMRKYGNMFRAGDVPNAYVANRVRTIDLRMLSADTAVHSDMLMWHPEEPVDRAALHLLNVLFSVPQVSVRLDEIPAEHTEMLAFYLDYWRRDRAVLLDGELVPTDAMANYPRVAAHGDEKTIVALFQELVTTLDPAHGVAEVDVINAKPGSRVAVDALADLGEYDYAIRDSRGRSVGEGTARLSAGLHLFEVPVSGLLQLVRRSDPDQ